MKHKLHIGIDASNIRAGGGITHLFELLNATSAEESNISQITIWASSKTLELLPEKNFLFKSPQKFLDKNIFFRIVWLVFKKKCVLKNSNIDILFVPGGTDFSNFYPKVSMSQNLLPFELNESRRYGLGFKFFKCLLLRIFQKYTFINSQGLIFLTPYARSAVLKVTGHLNFEDCIIPHGINDRFRLLDERNYRDVEEFTKEMPCRLLYVSVVEVYKHQWKVIEAIEILELRGFNVSLDLVGPMGPGKNKFLKSLNKYYLKGDSIKYHGSIPYDEIEKLYKLADIGVFASSCETYGQIVTEAMASKLPLVCSNLSSMSDILGNDGEYFNPENPIQIANAIQKMILSKENRVKYAESAYLKSNTLSWNKCSIDTFHYIQKIYSKSLIKK